MSVSFNLLVASGQRWPSTNRQILARLQPFPLAIDGVFSEKFSSFVCQIDDTVGSWWRVAFRVPGDVDAEQGNRNSMFNAGPVSRGDPHNSHENFTGNQDSSEEILLNADARAILSAWAM